MGMETDWVKELLATISDFEKVLLLYDYMLCDDVTIKINKEFNNFSIFGVLQLTSFENMLARALFNSFIAQEDDTHIFCCNYNDIRGKEINYNMPNENEDAEVTAEIFKLMTETILTKANDFEKVLFLYFVFRETHIDISIDTNYKWFELFFTAKCSLKIEVELTRFQIVTIFRLLSPLARSEFSTDKVIACSWKINKDYLEADKELYNKLENRLAKVCENCSY